MMLRHIPALQDYIRQQHPGDQFDYSLLINRIILANNQRSSLPNQHLDPLGRKGTFIKATIQISNSGLQTVFLPGNATIPKVEKLIGPDNPLDKAGIQKGDYITEIDGEVITTWDQGSEKIRNLLGLISSEESRPIKITVYRPLFTLTQTKLTAPEVHNDQDDGYEWGISDEAS
jgi:hypothetical protein